MSLNFALFEAPYALVRALRLDKPGLKPNFMHLRTRPLRAALPPSAQN
jgi:hypothetical protein